MSMPVHSSPPGKSALGRLPSGPDNLPKRHSDELLCPAGNIAHFPFDSPVNVPGGVHVVEPTVRWSRRRPLRSFRASSLGFCGRSR